MKKIKNCSILIKYPDMEREFDHLTQRTRAIVLYASDLLFRNFNCIPIWTSFYRADNKKSVHYFMRGADLSRRVIDISKHIEMRLLTDKESKSIVDNINKVFPYGKKNYKSCIFHKVKGSEYHFHCQSKE